MATLQLREDENASLAVAVLRGVLPPSHVPVTIHYVTRTGAVAYLDGSIVGAFDREHEEILVAASAHERVLELRVERQALPTNGLPPRDGVRWRLMQARSRPAPMTHMTIREASDNGKNTAYVSEVGADGIPLWGHSHLDVAWLWTYEETKRKAVRTFANALALMDRDPSFVFTQSQPQLYEFVREQDADLYARVKQRVAEGRWDVDVAAMWVEPDCNIPSGESLLRQMLFAHRFCVDEFGIEPSIAWLPDTFGFARTLPTLLAHAGIRYFGTTKLQWNDTTRFPYPQFRWRGPDGSEVVAALIASYEGGIDAGRINAARTRREPLVVGYGDGGGGPTAGHLVQMRDVGAWERPRAWFERLDASRAELPLHDDELYLEYHRGVYTTHHDVKARNAALERALADVEERLSWCVAVRASRDITTRLRAQLNAAWEIVLRNQFHDVLPGTSIAPVYDDAGREYAEAGELVLSARTATETLLPRGPQPRPFAISELVAEKDAFAFDNGIIRALVKADGTIVELRTAGGANVVAQANALARYQDRPQKWEAWNIDAGYQRSRRAAEPQPSSILDGTLQVPFRIGDSLATMRVALLEGEPFLRVDLAVDWHERRTLLRIENWLVVNGDAVVYGAPHGTVQRSARTDTPDRRARFEVPGARFACTQDDAGNGLALFALDTYGWDAQTLPGGGIRLGHSLLRATTWPDPNADRGEHMFSWAFAPLRGATKGAIERAWDAFANGSRVRLFLSEDDAVLVVACKPADDGNGVIVRVRECDGAERPVRLRSGGRMRGVTPVDALERAISDEVRIEGETLVASIPAFGLRSYRVTF